MRRLTVGVLVVVVVAAAAVASPNRALEILASVAADPIQLFVVLCLLAIVRPLLALPMSLLAGVVGYGYGFAGFPLGWGLAVVTTVPPYVFGSRGQMDIGREGRIAAAIQQFTTTGEQTVSVVGPTRSVAAARFMPIPSDVISVAAGISGVSIRPYLVGTAIGQLPWVAIGVVTGASANAIRADGIAAAFDIRFAVGLTAAAFLLLVGPLVRYVSD